MPLSRRVSIEQSKKPKLKFFGLGLLLALLAGGLFVAYQYHPIKVSALLAAKTVAPKVYTKTQTICLDAGHGGEDQGASYQDLNEMAVNLTVAKNVEQILEDDGYRVFMTRTSNSQTLDNNDRYTYCNTQKATILVSIHHNYFDDNSTDYSSALYYKDSDQGLATSLVNADATALGISNNGIANFDDGVLQKSNMPAAVIEGFFLTSDYEYSLLTASGSTRLTTESKAIATGIENYFKNPNQKATQVTTLDRE